MDEKNIEYYNMVNFEDKKKMLDKLFEFGNKHILELREKIQRSINDAYDCIVNYANFEDIIYSAHK